MKKKDGRINYFTFVQHVMTNEDFLRHEVRMMDQFSC